MHSKLSRLGRRCTAFLLFLKQKTSTNCRHGNGTCVKRFPNPPNSLYSFILSSCTFHGCKCFIVFLDMHRWFWRTLRPLYGSRTVITGQHSNTTGFTRFSQYVKQLALQVRCAGLIYLRFVVPPAKLFDKRLQLDLKQLWKFESHDTSIRNDFLIF